MTESELLAVLVEFSIGLGGFSAVAAAFIHKDRAMNPEDAYRILNMLLMALGPGFIAMFAIGVMSVGVTIRYANGLLLFFLLTGVLQAELGRRRLSSEQQKVLIPLVIVVMESIFVINGLIQLLSCLNILAGPFIMLYGGLVVVLAQAVVQFIRLIVARPDR